jgi:DNA-binding IclR family transcriptional regulator
MLGLKLFRLGSTVVSRFDVRQPALPVMERIHEKIGETTFLCVPRGNEAVCIERIDGKQVNLLALSLGGAMLLHTGSAPRALLAFQPPATWDTYLDSVTLEAFTPESLTTRKAVIDELRETRERGYAISDEDVTPGVASIGVPIFDHTGTVKGSLSIGGLRESVLGDGSPALNLARDAAAEISRTLGHDETTAG